MKQVNYKIKEAVGKFQVVSVVHVRELFGGRKENTVSNFVAEKDTRKEAEALIARLEALSDKSTEQ